MNINVAAADDHPAVLSGIARILSEFASIQLVGTARNSTEVVALLTRTPCDVLVTDYVMPGGEYGDGYSFLSFLRRRFPELKIVVFTMVDHPDLVSSLIRIGVYSVIHKSDDPRRLVGAVEAACAEGSTVRRNARRMAAADEPQSNSQIALLSGREIEVLRLYASGYSVTQIAEQLSRTKQTVSAQKNSAMRKMGIARDVDLFRIAYERKLFGMFGTAESHALVAEQTDERESQKQPGETDDT